MGKAFSSAYERVRWAEDNILELKDIARAHFTSHSYQRVSQYDIKAGQFIDKLVLIAPMPGSIARLTIQAMENLRFALDHAACAVTPRQFRKRTYFPFGDTISELEAALSSKCKHVPDDIKTLFRRLKPYERGNTPLWALNKCANTSKHRTIVQPGINVKDISFVNFPGASTLSTISPMWNRRKNEIILTRTSDKPTVHHDVDFSIGVSFGNIPFFRGKPVPSSLNKLARLTMGIVKVTESEARRIGAVKW
jgi:hypothetical protein